MSPPNYTWANCHNVTAEPPISPTIWASMVDFMSKNGNHEFGRDLLPPAFCDPENYVPPDQGKALLIFGMISTGIALLVVLGRFATRKFVAGRIGWDDWTIALAVFLMCCSCAVSSFALIKGGLGRHIYDNTSPEITLTLKVVFFHMLLYSLNVFMVKASLLFFYKRLFPSSWNRMQLFLTVTIVTLFLYAIASCFVAISLCNPIDAFWIVELRYSGCPTLENSASIYSGMRGISVSFDVLIILLPMKFLWGLKLPVKQRLGLACVFGLGLIALGAALLRLIYQPRVWQSLDLTWNFAIIVFAAQLEHCFAIVTASIPALTALLHRSRKNTPSTQTTLNCHDSTLRTQSLELTDTKPREFVSDYGVYEHRPGSALPPQPPQNSVLCSFNSNDFLTWAFDPERKNGEGEYGNFAIAYGEYTMNQSNKSGNCFSRFYRGWDKSDDGFVDQPPKTCGDDGNEILVDTPRAGNGVGQILLTCEVAVRHSMI